MNLARILVAIAGVAVVAGVFSFWLSADKTTLDNFFGNQVARVSVTKDALTPASNTGANDVVIGEDTAAFAQHAPYDLVLESVGGKCLAAALNTLAKDGVCVSLGGSASHEVTCDIRQFRQTGRTTLYGLILFEELALEPAAVGLAHLAGLIAAGKLKPTISVEAPWTQIGQVARQLLDRQFVGKAVLHVADGLR